MAGLNSLAVGGGVTDPVAGRQATGALLAAQGPTELDIRTGVLIGPGSTALLTGTADTGQMTVQIGVHHAVTSRGTANGPYVGPTLNAATKVNIAPAPGSGSRIDVVYVRQQDGNSGVPSPDVTTGPLYAVLQGNASTGTPAKPDLTTIPGAEELGTVTVAAGAASTNDSHVTIATTARQTTTRGGPVPVTTRASRLTLATYPSLQAMERDTGYLLWHDGTRWRYEGDRVIVTGTAARDALDAYAGLTAHDTSTGRTWLHNGTAWSVIAGGPGIRVTKAGTQPLSAGQFADIAWDTPAAGGPLAAAGMFDPAHPTRLIATVAGRYRANGYCGSGSNFLIRVNAAGSATGGTPVGGLTGLSSNNVGNVTADEVVLAVGDYAEFFVYNATASSAGFANGYGAAFSLSYVGPST